MFPRYVFFLKAVYFGSLLFTNFDEAGTPQILFFSKFLFRPMAKATASRQHGRIYNVNLSGS